MHIFRAFVILRMFSEGKRGVFWPRTHIRIYTHVCTCPPYLPPYPLFSSQKLARVASYSLPIGFRPETTPFICAMENRLVGAINAGVFLPKADKFVVYIFYFQLCFLHSVFEFINPISCLVSMNEPYYLSLKNFKGHAQGGSSFSDSLHVFHAELNSSPITDNPNSYHSFPLSYSSLVIL